MPAIVVTKLVREVHDVHMDSKHGSSIGTMVDDVIHATLMSGGEIHEVAFRIEPEEHNTLRDFYLPQPAEAVDIIETKNRRK